MRVSHDLLAAITLSIFDTIGVGFLWSTLYWYIIISWGNPLALGQLIWYAFSHWIQYAIHLAFRNLDVSCRVNLTNRLQVQVVHLHLHSA